MRRALRMASTVFIVAGLLMLIDAGLTVVWQEPVSAVYAHFTQEQLEGDLEELEKEKPSAVDQRALRLLPGDRRKMAFLARKLKRTAGQGEAVGRIDMPSIDVSKVIVNGTQTGDLRKGPGIYDRTVFPGAPGTVGVAGHRTTYGAPFRDVDDLERGDEINVTMPYGTFTYEVERTRIVPPTEVSVIDRVSFDRLVLSACHPLYSAAKRIIVFAKYKTAVPRGPAFAGITA